MIISRALLSLGLLASVLATVPAFAATPAPSASHDVTIFPPANESTGGGLLAFPPGSTKSYYAAPVLYDDPATVAAIKDQTKTITDAINTQGQQQTAAIQAQTAAVTGAINSGVTQLVAALKGIGIGTSVPGGGGSYVPYPSSITCVLDIPAGSASNASAHWNEERFPLLNLAFVGLTNGTYVFQTPVIAGSSRYDFDFNWTFLVDNNQPETIKGIYWPQPSNNTLTLVYEANTGKLLNNNLQSEVITTNEMVYGAATSNIFDYLKVKHQLVCPQSL